MTLKTSTTQTIKALLLIVLLLSVALIAPDGRADFTEIPIFENYPSEVIGATGRIFCVAEDPTGQRLYAGADKLFVFDGASWNEIGSNETRQIWSIALE